LSLAIRRDRGVERLLEPDAPNRLDQRGVVDLGPVDSRRARPRTDQGTLAAGDRRSLLRVVRSAAATYAWLAEPSALTALRVRPMTTSRPSIMSAASTARCDAFIRRNFWDKEAPLIERRPLVPLPLCLYCIPNSSSCCGH